MTYRVIPNPLDGTSVWRARLMTGEGKTLRLIAMFTDEGEANKVAALLEQDGPRIHTVRLPKGE